MKDALFSSLQEGKFSKKQERKPKGILESRELKKRVMARIYIYNCMKQRTKKNKK